MLGCPDPGCPTGHGYGDLPGRLHSGSVTGPAGCGNPEHLYRSPVKLSVRTLFRPESQRGTVLPLAMLSLLVLSAVLIGLSMLTGQEPLVASNHVMMVQAQALAEAGLERALWALSSPQAPEGVAWTGAAPAPYDGSQLIRVATDVASLGGFRLTISGESDRQRQVVAIGLVPGSPGRPCRTRRSHDRQRGDGRRERGRQLRGRSGDLVERRYDPRLREPG